MQASGRYSTIFMMDFPRSEYPLCDQGTLRAQLNKSGHSVDQGKSTVRLTCPPIIEPLTV